MTFDEYAQSQVQNLEPLEEGKLYLYRDTVSLVTALEPVTILQYSNQRPLVRIVMRQQLQDLPDDRPNPSDIKSVVDCLTSLEVQRKKLQVLLEAMTESTSDSVSVSFSSYSTSSES